MNIQTNITAQNLDLDTLDDKQLTAMHYAGQEVMHWQAVLQKTEDTPITELLRYEDVLDYDTEYPPETVQDHETGIPTKIRAVKPAVTGEHSNKFRTHCHLAAIVTTGKGEPKSLFTINHWSAHDARYSTGDMVKILDRFDVSHAVPSYPLNRWVSALMRFFRPQLIQLFKDREVTLAEFAQAMPDIPAMENEDLEVTSKVDISVSEQFSAVARELDRRGLVAERFYAK